MTSDVFDWFGPIQGPAPLPRSSALAQRLRNDTTGVVYAAWRAMYFCALEHRT